MSKQANLITSINSYVSIVFSYVSIVFSRLSKFEMVSLDVFVVWKLVLRK